MMQSSRRFWATTWGSKRGCLETTVARTVQQQQCDMKTSSGRARLFKDIWEVGTSFEKARIPSRLVRRDREVRAS